jgi:hypothetical protein
VEVTPKNKQLDVSYYSDTGNIHEGPFNFTFFDKSVICVKLNTIEGVSIQPDWVLSGFDKSFMEFIRLIVEQGNRYEEEQWR